MTDVPVEVPEVEVPAPRAGTFDNPILLTSVTVLDWTDAPADCSAPATDVGNDENPAYWFRYTPPRQGSIRLRSGPPEDPTVDMVVEVFVIDPASPTGLTLVASEDDQGSDTHFDLTVVADRELFIRVSSYDWDRTDETINTQFMLDPLPAGPPPDTYKWSLYDPQTGASYRFAINPNAMTSPHAPRSTRAVSRSPIDGQIRAFRAHRVAHIWEFSGVLRTKEQHDTLRAWCSSPRIVILKDHLNRRWQVRLFEFAPVERRPVPSTGWRFRYTIRAYVHGKQT